MSAPRLPIVSSSAIAADDIPQAIQRLRQALQAYAAHLLGLLERAGVANVPLMWEVA